MNTIRIYNSLTREKRPFEPISSPEVKMYVCGPTVYDEPHIGHARSAYIFDVIRRYLQYKGYKVKFVRNVTDVDDKIIDKALKEYPQEELNNAVKKVSLKYLEAYHRALTNLGIPSSKPEVIEPKASEYISKMIEFIQQLIERGAAYQAGGDVYFDITKAKNYGKLSNQVLDKMEAGARVSPLENKKNPLDFALWKSAKENEPSWDSPWGKGRPGWHIECSVMSSDILGDTFDIHGGGLDLIFPHHENEIAQSEGAGKKFARIWIHHGLLTINGQKMAKSLGNFITVEKLIEKYHPDVLKTFFLRAHYSSPIDFSDKIMKEETERYKSFVYLFRYYQDYQAKNLPENLNAQDREAIDEYKQRFIKAMDDDFNTPQALAALEQLKSYAFPLAVNEGLNKNWGKFKYAVDTIGYLMNEIFSLHPEKADPVNDRRLFSENGGLRDLIWAIMKSKERERLKKEKKYTEADKIRKELEENGFIVLDRKDGTSELRPK